jgi:hypothetical protein
MAKEAAMMRPTGPVGVAGTLVGTDVGVRVAVVMMFFPHSWPPGAVGRGTTVAVRRSARPGHMAGIDRVGANVSRDWLDCRHGIGGPGTCTGLHSRMVVRNPVT